MKRIILFHIIAMMAFINAYATDVGGVISVNTVWTTENSPYIVRSNLLVQEGVDLIIEPGVEVRFDSNLGIWSYGKIIAQGTESDKIIFTANSSDPYKGFWSGILFDNKESFISNANGEYISGSILKHCIIEYANTINDQYSVILVNNSSAYIESISVRHCYNTGLLYNVMRGTNIILRNIEGTDLNNGVKIRADGKVRVSKCNLYNIFGDGLRAEILSSTDYNTEINIDSCNFINCSDKGLGIMIGAQAQTNILNCNSYNNNYGLYIVSSPNSSSVLNVQNSFFHTNNYGIFFNYGATHPCRINYCSIYENSYNSIYLNDSNTKVDVDATNNWWGTTDEIDIDKSIYDFWDSFNKAKINYKPYSLAPIFTYSLFIYATNGSVTKNPDQASYNAGSSVTLTATPSPGYSFTGWSGDATGSTNPLTITMDANKTITANFQIVQYTVSTSSNPANGGTTSGAGMYNAGQSATVTATPALNFHFVNWTENGSQISSNSSYSFTVNSNRTLVANFANDSNLTPYVLPYVSNRQTPPLFANNEWYLDIEVGDNILPVTNLYAVSVTLDFSASHGLIEVVSESAESFLGEDLLFFANRDNAFDSLRIMVSRSGLQDGVNGFGTIARVKFRNKTNIPSANSIFMVTKNIKGFDPVGGDVPLRGSSFVVPVELSSFTATVAGKNVYLNWRTESETNNYGFEIERMITRNGGWEKIGFVSGNGTSSQPNDYCYTDTGLQPGQVNYRLKQIDNDGTYTYSQIVTVNVEDIPIGFTLFQNSPNPFNPVTSISYYLSQESLIKLRVFDLQGREIEILVDGLKSAGQHTVSWDAKGRPSGIYLYCLEAGRYREMKRALLLK